MKFGPLKQTIYAVEDKVFYTVKKPVFRRVREIAKYYC
jgi:hypothetical protein